MIFNTDCCCHIYTDEDGEKFLIVCPMHYGMMLEDLTIDYGLCTTLETNKELHEKYGVPILTTPKDFNTTNLMMKPSGWKHK